MDLKLTLIALAARHIIGRKGRRPSISWVTYVRAGGPVLRKRVPLA